MDYVSKVKGLEPPVLGVRAYVWGLAVRGWPPSGPTHCKIKLQHKFVSKLKQVPCSWCNGNALEYYKVGRVFKPQLDQNFEHMHIYADIIPGHVAAFGLAMWHPAIRCPKEIFHGKFQGIFCGIFFFKYFLKKFKN